MLGDVLDKLTDRTIGTSRLQEQRNWLEIPGAQMGALGIRYQCTRRRSTRGASHRRLGGEH